MYSQAMNFIRIPTKRARKGPKYPRHIFPYKLKQTKTQSVSVIFGCFMKPKNYFRQTRATQTIGQTPPGTVKATDEQTRPGAAQATVDSIQ
jgi:hypothetical protein